MDFVWVMLNGSIWASFSPISHGHNGHRLRVSAVLIVFVWASCSSNLPGHGAHYLRVGVMSLADSAEEAPMQRLTSIQR